MEDSLANPIQCMEADTKIDLRPRKFYPDDESAQTITFANGLSIPIEHDGPLPFIHVCRPTLEELET